MNEFAIKEIDLGYFLQWYMPHKNIHTDMQYNWYMHSIL